MQRQLDAFEANLAEVDLSYAKKKNLTVYDVLTIASMIEREIQVLEERRLAAAVIYNRLAADDVLGIDATIRYEDGNYDEQLTESRLAEDTPYNTRVNPGLLPTLIGNPGLASIEAAAKPAKSDAYYFVVKPGTCGEHVFVETRQEFANAEAEYQQALEAEGGSPTEAEEPCAGLRSSASRSPIHARRRCRMRPRRPRPRRRVELRGDRGGARGFRGSGPLARD